MTHLPLLLNLGGYSRPWSQIADVTVVGMACALVSLLIMTAVDLIDERVGIKYLIVHCECTSHRNGYRAVCELGTIDTFGLLGGLQRR